MKNLKILKKNQQKITKQKMTLIDLKQKEKEYWKNSKMKEIGFGKNFQLQMTKNQQMKKEKMILDKKLILGKLTWQTSKSLE